MSGPVLTSIFQLSPQLLGELKLQLSHDPPTIPYAAVQGSPVVIRGSVDATGATVNGEGFSCTRSATGVYAVTYNTSADGTPVFGASPAVSVTWDADQFMLAPVVTVDATSGFTVKGYDNTATAANSPFHFIAYAQALS